MIKVIWAREWDELLARDVDGVLVEKMNDTLDGEFQKYSVAGGAYIREHFFGPDPRLRKLVEHLSDDDLAKLRRGGHDYRKVYAAYKAATEYKGAPTVILAKTVKGWTLGPGVEARNITHQAKKLSEAELKIFRDRLELPIPDAKLKDAPYYHPGPDSEEVQYLRERRKALGGSIPQARRPLAAAAGAGRRRRQGVRGRLRDAGLDDDGLHPDPAEPHPRQGAGAADRADHPGRGADVRHGPALQGSRDLRRARPALRAGRFGARPAATARRSTARSSRRASPRPARWPRSRPRRRRYATHGHPMIPFYIFYSMFGFQRTGDQIWALGDARGRGFMMGATAGRTTLTRRGPPARRRPLATSSPRPSRTASAYDPAYAYELAAIVRDGIERMYAKGEDVFYYVTLYNENYAQPPKPEGVDEGILRGLYRLREAPDLGRKAHRARLVGSGSILQQVVAAQELLAEKFGIAAEIYSAPSFPLLRRDALEAERWNRLHPDKEPRVPYVSTVLGPDGGPIVAATDWLKALPDMVARWLPPYYVSLGTDGFGRSDTREALRSLFEIDAAHVAAATLAELARCAALPAAKAAAGIRELGIDPEKLDPVAL